MTTYWKETVQDIRCGRQNWRVVVATTLPSFAIAIALALVQHHH